MRARIVKWHPMRPYGYARLYGESGFGNLLFVHGQELPADKRQCRHMLGYEFDCDVLPPTRPGNRRRATNIRTAIGPDVDGLPKAIAEIVLEAADDGKPRKKQRMKEPS